MTAKAFEEALDDSPETERAEILSMPDRLRVECPAQLEASRR